MGTVHLPLIPAPDRCIKSEKRTFAVLSRVTAGLTDGIGFENVKEIAESPNGVHPRRRSTERGGRVASILYPDFAYASPDG